MRLKFADYCGRNRGVVMLRSVMGWRVNLPAMPDAISNVFGWRSPAQIKEPVVEGIAIAVQGHLAHRTRADECLKDDAGDLPNVRSIVLTQRNKAALVSVPDGLNPSRHDAAIDSPPRSLARPKRTHSTEIGDFVVWEIRYFFPLLHSPILT